MQKKRVAVSVLNYNSWKETISCLDSLLDQTYNDYKIILIDNGSVDDSVSKITEYLRKHNIQHRILVAKNGQITPVPENHIESTKVFFILSDDNLGFAGGHNMGARFATDVLGADYVFILNNDVVLGKDTVEALVRCAERTGVAVIQPTVIELRDRMEKPWNALLKLKHLLLKTARKAENRRHNCTSGAAFMVRKDVIENIGLFDENLFLYYEDTDFFQRVYEKYSGCYVAPNIKVYHKGSRSSGGRLSPIVVYYTARNGIYFFKKHYKCAYSTVKIIINIFLIEHIKRYIHTILNRNLNILKYYYIGIRDAALGRYGRRADLHIECVGKKRARKKQ